MNLRKRKCRKNVLLSAVLCCTAALSITNSAFAESFIGMCKEIPEFTDAQSRLVESEDELESLGLPISDPALIVTQKGCFRIPQFSTVSGKIIENLEFGWEAYGNPEKPVILIPHFFSGHSHFAGYYYRDSSEDKPKSLRNHEEKPVAGWWDKIIGKGKPINTEDFYVIAADNPININTNLDYVKTTGPCTETDGEKIRGANFPDLYLEDFVESQKLLLEGLGIIKYTEDGLTSRLSTVAGPSGGGLQALIWATKYPEYVDKIITVAAPAKFDDSTRKKVALWKAPLKEGFKDSNSACETQPDEINNQFKKSHVYLGIHGIIRHSHANGLKNNKDNSDYLLESDVTDDEVLNTISEELFEAKFSELLTSQGKKTKNRSAWHFANLVDTSLKFDNKKMPVFKNLENVDTKVLIAYSSEDYVFAKSLMDDTHKALRHSPQNRKLDLITGKKGCMEKDSQGHLDSVSKIHCIGKDIEEFLTNN